MTWLHVFLWFHSLTLKAPEKLHLYGFYVYYVVHICDFGMLRVNPFYNYHLWGSVTSLVEKAEEYLWLAVSCFSELSGVIHWNSIQSFQHWSLHLLKSFSQANPRGSTRCQWTHEPLTPARQPISKSDRQMRRICLTKELFPSPQRLSYACLWSSPTILPLHFWIDYLLFIVSSSSRIAYIFSKWVASWID